MKGAPRSLALWLLLSLTPVAACASDVCVVTTSPNSSWFEGSTQTYGANGLMPSCMPCQSDSDCSSKETAAAPFLYCGVDGICAPCWTDSQCAGLDAGTPFCLVSSNACVECTSASKCPASAPGCSLGCGNVCGRCATDSDCPSPMTCVVDAGFCGACEP